MEEGFPFPATGRHHLVAWGGSGPTIVVARTTFPGKPWARFVRKISGPGWWGSCYKTFALAKDPHRP